MTNYLKYSDQIALHEKAKNILSLKIGFIKRLDQAQDTLQRWDNATAWDPIRLVNDRPALEHDADICQRAIKWLNRYYMRVAGEVCRSMATVEIKEVTPVVGVEFGDFYFPSEHKKKEMFSFWSDRAKQMNEAFFLGAPEIKLSGDTELPNIYNFMHIK